MAQSSLLFNSSCDLAEAAALGRLNGHDHNGGSSEDAESGRDSAYDYVPASTVMDDLQHKSLMHRGAGSDKFAFRSLGWVLQNISCRKTCPTMLE